MEAACGNQSLVKSIFLLMEGNLSFLVDWGGTIVDPFGRALAAQIHHQDLLQKVPSFFLICKMQTHIHTTTS
jgi:hypothetical protein